MPWLQWCCQFWWHSKVLSWITLLGRESMSFCVIRWCQWKCHRLRDRGWKFWGRTGTLPEDPTAAVILSACISNPGEPLRSSGCSKMWDRSFHESWMVFLKCGRYRVWCMGLGCWTMPVRCLAGEWDISDELAHTTVTGMHFKGDGWPRSKLKDHWFMSRRIGEDW